MSDEDALSEMKTTPAQLMPKSLSLQEHHRVLSINAIHAGHTIATIKAHHVRQNNFQERLEDVEGVKEAVWGIRAEFAAFNKAMASHGEAIGDISKKLAEQSTSNEIKKAVVTGIFTLLIAIVTAYTGYVMGHSPSTSQEPPYKEKVHVISPATATTVAEVKR